MSFVLLKKNINMGDYDFESVCSLFKGITQNSVDSPFHEKLK